MVGLYVASKGWWRGGGVSNAVPIMSRNYLPGKHHSAKNYGEGNWIVQQNFALKLFRHLQCTVILLWFETTVETVCVTEIDTSNIITASFLLFALPVCVCGLSLC